MSHCFVFPDFGDPRGGFSWDLPSTFNAGTAVFDHASPDATALRHVAQSGRTHKVTYAELDAASDTVAAALAEWGVGEGDRVAISLPQSPELLVGHLAALKRGAIVVPVSIIAGDETVGHVLDATACASAIFERAQAARFDRAGDSSTDISLTLREEHYVEWGALGAFGEHVAPDRTVGPVATAPDDPAFLMFTSGTTSKPKGVVQGHEYLLGSLPGYQLYFHLRDQAAIADQRVWTPAEWAWAGALFDVVYPTLLGGGTVVSRPRREGFDPGAAFELIEGERVTRAFLPPTALHRIREATMPPAFDPSSLSVIMCGGEPLSADLRVWAVEALDLVVNEAYGQTEANSVLGEADAWYDTPDGATGRAYPGHEIAVEPEDGERARSDARGELLVRRDDPVVFQEYWNDTNATDMVTAEDGWLRTGDLAHVDADGYVTIEGRVDDLIISSGYRISPVAIERVLERHALVGQALVGGIADERRGERMVAYVVTVDGEDVDSTAFASELRDRVSSELGPHKKPRSVEIRESLPVTTSGKLDRSALF